MGGWWDSTADVHTESLHRIPRQSRRRGWPYNPREVIRHLEKGAAEQSERRRFSLQQPNAPYSSARHSSEGILCNVLFCLAVSRALAGRNVADRVVAILFPVSAFVAAGREHSVANMYFVPLGIFLQIESGADFAAGVSVASSAGFSRNLIPVTSGNLAGGAGLVGPVYYINYGRRTNAPPSGNLSSTHLETTETIRAMNDVRCDFSQVSAPGHEFRKNHLSAFTNTTAETTGPPLYPAAEYDLMNPA